MCVKLTTELFIKQANEIHNNKYDYSKSIYTSSTSKIIIICKIHQEFEQKASSHLEGHGCRKCSAAIIAKNQALTNTEFIEVAKLIHGDKYDYSLCNYINRHTEIEIICNKHKIIFKLKPKLHLNLNGGCKKCLKDNNRLSTKTTETFIEQANKKHNFKFNYSKCKYLNYNKKVIIICNIHGEFSIIPSAHISGSGGCNNCSNLSTSIKNRLTQNEFIEKANKKHNYIYDYSKTTYIKAYDKIIITCKIHGDFKQVATDHLKGSGCPKCAYSISRIEIKWLNYLNVPEEYRQSKIKINNREFKLDAYNPNTNTIYEFHGDYWHGNPEKYKPNDINKNNKRKFSELYAKTIERENILKEAGYNLVTMWESSFKKILKQK